MIGDHVRIEALSSTRRSEFGKNRRNFTRSTSHLSVLVVICRKSGISCDFTRDTIVATLPPRDIFVTAKPNNDLKRTREFVTTSANPFIDLRLLTEIFSHRLELIIINAQLVLKNLIKIFFS